MDAAFELALLAYTESMRTPRGWRATTVEGLRYLWCAKVGRDAVHDTLRVFVRPAEDVQGVRLRARGGTLIVDSGMGGPRRCNGPQCTVLAPPRPISPAHIAAFVREARALGWDERSGSFRVALELARFVGADVVALQRV